jgi:hypothetical protein
VPSQAAVGVEAQRILAKADHDLDGLLGLDEFVDYFKDSFATEGHEATLANTATLAFHPHTEISTPSPVARARSVTPAAHPPGRPCWHMRTW